MIPVEQRPGSGSCHHFEDLFDYHTLSSISPTTSAKPNPMTMAKVGPPDPSRPAIDDEADDYMSMTILEPTQPLQKETYTQRRIRKQREVSLPILVRLHSFHSLNRRRPNRNHAIRSSPPLRSRQPSQRPQKGSKCSPNSDIRPEVPLALSATRTHP